MAMLGSGGKVGASAGLAPVSGEAGGSVVGSLAGSFECMDGSATEDGGMALLMANIIPVVRSDCSAQARRTIKREPRDQPAQGALRTVTWLGCVCPTGSTGAAILQGVMRHEID